MNARAGAAWTRWTLLGGLVAASLLLSGCVYLRLLQVKRQLGDFDRFFALDTHEGIRLSCLTPVLLTDDFRWLGITPETTRHLGQSELWNVRWVKEEPAEVGGSLAASASERREGTLVAGPLAGARSHPVRDVEIELLFTEDKLTRLHIPEGYFSLIPKEFLIGLLRGLGSANIDKLNRDAAVAFGSAKEMRIAQVTATSLAMLLGKPSEQVVEGTRTTLRYRYVPTPPGAKNGVFDLSFVFDTTTGQLVFLRGRSPVGQMSFNFEPTSLNKAKSPKG